MNQQAVTPGGPQGGSSTMKWLLIVLVIVIVLGGGYLVWTKYGGGTSTATASPSPATSVKASPSATVSPTAQTSESPTVSNLQVAKDFYTFYLNLSKNGSQAKFASTNPYKLKSDFTNYLTSSLISRLEDLFNDPATNYDPIVCAQDLPSSIDYSSSGSDVIAKMNFASVKNVTLKFTNSKISAITCP